MTTHPSGSLIVAGVVSYDYLVYSYPHSSPQVPTTRDGHDCRLVIRTGASDLVAKLLIAAAPQWGFEVLRPVAVSPAADGSQHGVSAVVDLELSQSTFSNLPTFKVVRIRQTDRAPMWHSPPSEQMSAAKASTVIISGSGESPQDIAHAEDFLRQTQPAYIVHHMKRPLATGHIWDVIRDGPRTDDGGYNPDHLAVIVDAEDLRAEGISLNRSLSWETTAEDFVKNLGSNGRVDTLVTCPNLIVRFGNEGVIHHRGRDAVNPKIYYNTGCVEKDASSATMIELASAFTAGFALGFANSSSTDCARAIKLGISAAREMEKHAFMPSLLDGAPDYPVDTIMAQLTPDKSFWVTSIPSGHISSGDSWNIFENVTGDFTELARQIVTLGPDKALSRCPTQKFHNLVCVERCEQESLRAVVGAVEERMRADLSRPISISILGPLGSGKKFVASNLAQYFAKSMKVQQVTFNARLLRPDDLGALCHTIRDHSAAGLLPVVCFENFEAILEPMNELKNDFLVMMRDGLFTDRGHVRSLGRPVLIFLVNQELPILELAPTPTAAEHGASRIDYSLALEHSHGIVRLPGPNQTSADDKLFCVRRALMLRQMLEQKFPRLNIGGTIKIDDAVLHALLQVPSFKHGLRSLEKILTTSRLSGKAKFDVSALPPEEQIQLYVDPTIFMSFLRSPRLPAALREKLAEGLFEAYKRKRREIARTPEEQRALDSDPSLCDWDELALELKESTRAQADDIPRKLRALDCFMLDQKREEPLVHVPAFTEKELDMLAEMEHERFNAERLQRQWRMGPRNSNKRTTPFLVPWRDLTQDWKDVDRVMVECVPHLLSIAGWWIYRMQSDE